MTSGLENSGANNLPNGGCYSIVGEPLTVDEEYVAVWKRAKLDTDEMAQLRFSLGVDCEPVSGSFRI